MKKYLLVISSLFVVLDGRAGNEEIQFQIDLEHHFNKIYGHKLIKKEARVLEILDGDTLTIRYKNNDGTYGDVENVRIAEIDAPELNQPFGYEAKELLEKTILNHDILLFSYGRDKYQRTFARITTKIPTLFEASAWLIMAGLAWVYKDFSKDNILITLEKKAQKEEKGLWNTNFKNNQIPPWEFRKEHEWTLYTSYPGFSWQVNQKHNYYKLAGKAFFKTWLQVSVCGGILFFLLGFIIRKIKYRIQRKKPIF